MTIPRGPDYLPDDPAAQRAHDLALLAAGQETGFWGEDGKPAPWPEDFLDPDSGWAPDGNTDNTPPAPGEPPF